MTLALPPKRTAAENVLATMRKARARDAKWREGKTWSLVYRASDDVTELLKEAYTMFFSENGLNPTAFPSLKKFEAEVTAMTASLLGGDEETVGNMTSGGTESILMAVKTARDWGHAVKSIAAPEMILPASAHPAFEKAAHYFSVKAIHIPVGSDFRADVVAARDAITPNTVLMVGSAPSYPQGVIDPIVELAHIAQENDLLFHTDACVGGFMLPFVRKMGYSVPNFDFSVPGVTSLSVDLHKYAYAAVVLLAVYSAYFQGKVVGGAEGSRLWGLAVGIAMLVVAVTSPVLGAIADFSGAKKRFLFVYTAASVLFTAGLFFATPGNLLIGMGCFILAEIGYRGAQVFYNALLPEIATHEEMGRVSGYGWAIGTAGGILCLLLILPLIIFFGDSFADDTFIVRLSLVITALFWALSAAPIFLWLTERAESRPLPPGESYLSVAFKQLQSTIKKAGRFKEFVKYMLAFLIYNDGVIMALDFAAIIGAVLFGLDQEMLIIFVIIVQATNVVGAYAFGELVDRIGGKRTLALSILMMIGVVLALYFHAATGIGADDPSQVGFFIIGGFAGFAMAGVQSVSRTMVAMFSPPGQSAEFYGFFSMTGRTSSFIGPAVYGWIAAEAALWYQAQGQTTALAEQLGQRLAILSIGAFLLVGLALLWFVNESKAREAAKTS